MIYCGPACRKEANDAYHKYECGITDVIHKAQIGGWALAYRAITTHPFEYFLENKDKILNSNELLGSKDHNDEVSFSHFLVVLHKVKVVFVHFEFCSFPTTLQPETSKLYILAATYSFTPNLV